MSSDKNMIYVNSDDFNSRTVYLASLALKNGEKVEKEQIVAVVETSKKVIDIASSFDGYIYYFFKEGESFSLTEPLATVSPAPLKDFKITKVTSSNSEGFTLKAKKLAERFNLSKENFKGMKSIKEEDVLFLMKESKIEVNAFESHLVLAEENLAANDYTSSVSVSFDMTLLNAKLKSESEALKKNVSIDSLFSHAAHKMLQNFERLSSYIENTDLIVLGSCPVGIYISEENKKASTYILEESVLQNLDSTVDRFYDIYRNFLNNDIEGKVQRSAFFISNMMSMNVKAITPMLKKGTVATLAIASPDKNGEYVVTLAFDHRLLDGSYAARFLNALKIFIEKN